jgi:hypothetical protein
MDIRTRKTKFLESLDSTEVILKAVSLAIDCIIDNNNSNEDTPLVITSYDDFCRIQVLNYVQEFCEAAFPDMDEYYFNPNILRINGKTSEEACINLIKFLRSTKAYYSGQMPHRGSLASPTDYSMLLTLIKKRYSRP